MRRSLLRVLLVAPLLAIMSSSLHGQKMYDLPTYCEAVDQAVSDENLKAAASQVADPDVLLGLAFLARTGSPARRQISQRAVNPKPEYAPVVAMLVVMMDIIDENSVAELIKRDPDNALGHYLRGSLLHTAGKEQEGLEAFRKAVACSELRLYESTTGAALFKALDALNLHGRDRLCALSWTATRTSNFGATGLQPLTRVLSELGRSGDIGGRQEVSEMLMVLAGHLFASNFRNQWFAQRAVESAFRLKAELAAAEKSPAMNGYTAVVQALVSVRLSWPGIADSSEEPLEVARFLPSRVHRAFAVADPALMTSSNLFEMKVDLAESDKPAFEQAKANATEAAKALIEIALTDPDGIIGAYLKGRPPRRYEDGPWVAYYTPVEKLMSQKPEVFKAAMVNEQAMRALSEAGKGDPRRRNIRRMMEIGLALHSYAADHNGTYPETLKILFDKSYLKRPLETTSLISGRPYVYVAAGGERPTKGTDSERMILLYDDEAAEGNYQCVMADGSGQQLRVDLVREQLSKRGK